MAAILSTNMASLYAQRSMATAQSELSGSVEKLSSGKRINSAKDDAAGLGISQSIAGISNINNQSVRNLQNATSLVQTADGALDVVGKMLQRILTLTTQKNDQALNSSQRSSIDAEVTALTDEIARIKDRTKFNGTGSIFGQTYTFGAGAGVTTTIEIPDLTTASLGLQTQAQTLTTTVINDSLADTFNITNHGYATGDQVVYYNGSGNSIGGLTDGATYYVIRVDANTFKLASSASNASSNPPTPINLTSLATATDNYLQRKLPINEVGFSNASTDVLVLSEPTWGANSYLLFNKGTATNFSPLTDATVYQVRANDGISITLKNLAGTAITFAANANLTGSSLAYLDRGFIQQSSAVVNDGTDTFTINAHGLTTGQQIFFTLDNLTVGNLANNSVYYVINTGTNTFKLASSLSNANGSPPSAIDIGTVSGSGSFTIRYAATVANSFNINPILQSNTIQISDGSFISNGDQIIYRKGASDDLIGNLTDGATYYVVNKSGNTIQLSSSQNGSAISLTTVTNYSASTFEKISSGSTFDASSSSVLRVDNSLLRSASSNGYVLGDEIIYGVSGGTSIGGLTNGTSYYAIPVTGTDFRVATSRANALAGISLSLGSDGTGTDQFSTNSAITVSTVNTAITNNATNRAKLGSYLSGLSYSIDNLETMSNNLGDAYSRIVDTDFAAETAKLTKNKILQEASAAMLAQANQMPNVVLSLLK